MDVVMQEDYSMKRERTKIETRRISTFKMWVEEMQSFKDVGNIHLERLEGNQENGAIKVKDWFLETAWLSSFDVNLEHTT